MNIIFDDEELKIIQQAIICYKQVIKKTALSEYLNKVEKLDYRIDGILMEE